LLIRTAESQGIELLQGASMGTATGDGRVTPPGTRRRPLVRGIQIALSVAVVVAIFALVIPKIASYGDVWKTIADLTWMEITSLALATILNLITYWWQMQAAMPGLSFAQAAVNNQSSTTIANILPGGGVIGLGVAYTMFHSWGFTGSEIALLISTTGIWNTFLKLGLPVIAVAMLAITGKATSALLVPAGIGLAVLGGSILLFGMVLWKKELARRIGSEIGRAWSWIRRRVRKEPVTTWGEGAVRFRKRTIKLIAKKWPELTLTTLVSHLSLWLVFLLTLRHVGVSEQEVSTVQVLAIFAFARLLSAAPITPGGVGVVELALIGGLYAAGRNHADVPPEVLRTQVTAAALLFRTLTYGIQIPLGGFAYMIWQRKRSWRRDQPEASQVVPEAISPR
jgi:putative heme transporter